MKADSSIHRHHNQVLKHALTAVNQYFLHARMLGNWGFRSLEGHEYQASIRAMRHADVLIERLLFLEGLPNLQDLGKLLIGEDVQEMLASDLLTARDYRDALAAAIAGCEQGRDFVSRHHLEELQEEAEERIDWLETQGSLIRELGIANYLESAM